MRMNRGWAVMAAMTMLGAFALPALAQDAQSVKRVDLTLQGAELLSALQALSLQTGIEFSIQVSDQDKLNRVTVSLRGKTAEEAIRYICDAAGVVVEKDETGVFVIRSKSAPVRVEAPVAPINVRPTLRKISLRYSDPKDMYRRIVFGAVPDAAQDIYDLRNQMDKMGPRNAIPGPTIVDIGRSLVENQAAPAPISGALGAEDIRIPGADASAQRGGGAGGFGGGQPGGGFGGGGGQPGGGFGGGGGQPGGGGIGGGAGGGQGLGLAPGQGLLPPSTDPNVRFSYDPADNSIIIYTTDADFVREVEKLIEQLDVRPKQVDVDVKYITTSNSRDRSLGMDWLYQRAGVFAGNRPGSFARVNDPIFINYAVGNLTTRLRTILNDGWGRVVNNPRVTTMNNQPATFTANTNTTIFVNQIVSGNGGIVIAPQPISISIQSGISVRPRINNDGTVSMIIATQLGDFGQVRRGPDGTEIPDQLFQFVSVAVNVRSGETVALGGLTRKLDNYSRSRIPVLSDLPIIGQLFQGRNEQTSTQDLTIFVTPTIVNDESSSLTP